MNIEDGFRDLAPLDPSGDPERWERMVGSITRAAAPELARRSRSVSPALLLQQQLSDWMRPIFSTAGVLAAAAGVLLLMGRPGADLTADAGVSAALGYPDPIAAWVEAEYTPSVEELLVAFEGDV